MNTRHVTSLVAAGAAIVMLLSGCGSTGTSNSSNASDSNIISVYGSEPAHPLFPGNTTEAGGGKGVDQLFAGLVTYDAKGGIHNEMCIRDRGNDAPMPALSSRSRMLFDYFTQKFAQVTNPPLDWEREEIVTSLESAIGPEPNLLADSELHAKKILIPLPVVNSDEMAQLKMCIRDRL